MANKALFSKPGRHLPVADTTNNAGGKAYKLDSHQALAQFAMTGTFNDTFYVGAAKQLSELNAILPTCTPEFAAKAAVYARQVGFMKDMPAYLCAYLFVAAKADPGILPIAHQVFDLVINNGKQLRNFVQFLRSGAIVNAEGKANKSVASSAIKKAIGRWFQTASWHKLINGSVGNDPSLRDVLRLAHPKPRSEAQDAVFSWIKGDGAIKDTENYPDLLKELREFQDNGGTPPAVDFRLLVSDKTTKETWRTIAMNATWHFARMNLNTFQRHELYSDDEVVDHLVALLKDPEEIRKAKVFPYQLLTAFQNTDSVPVKLRNALQDALDVSLDNVPGMAGAKIVVCPDTSGSMQSAVTGARKGSTSKTRCIDIAGLVAAAILRKNEDTLILPFSTTLFDTKHLNSRDSVMTNAQFLANCGGGGTNCSLPLAYLNAKQVKADLVFYVSDNESWADRRGHSVTGLQAEWASYKRKFPKAKLVLLDITPGFTSQAVADKDILRIGGFSDDVFQILPDFLDGKYGADAWVEKISKISLDPAVASGE